jgi:hypothetical protein
MYKSPMTSFKG